MNPLRLELPADALDALADLVAERVAQRLAASAPAEDDGWLSTKAAAEYLGVTPNSLHKLTSERTIPFEQSGRGGRCWFKRSDLDTWRRR